MTCPCNFRVTVAARVRGWKGSSPQTVQIFCQQAEGLVVLLTPCSPQAVAEFKQAEPAQELSH